jgi:signal peptidase II
LKALYVSLAVVIVDQVSKLMVKGFTIPFLNFNYDGMFLGQVIPVIGDFFRITFVENPGMAFGYDPGNSFKLIISIFSLIASIGLILYLYVIRDRSWSLRIAIAMILGGAIGNLIDRTFYGILYNYAPVFYGRVVDFFDFNFFDFTLLGRSYDRWPVFNVADASVTVGVLILLFFYKKHQETGEKEKNTKLTGVPINDIESNLATTVDGNNTDPVQTETVKSEKLENEQTDNPKAISN